MNRWTRLGEWVILPLLALVLGVVVSSMWWARQPAPNPTDTFCWGHVEGVAVHWLTVNRVPVNQWALTVTEDMMTQAHAECMSNFRLGMYEQQYPFPGPGRAGG